MVLDNRYFPKHAWQLQNHLSILDPPFSTLRNTVGYSYRQFTFRRQHLNPQCIGSWPGFLNTIYIHT
jgi:hypothetical protein